MAVNQTHQKDLLSACQAVAQEVGIDHDAHVGELQTILSHPSVVELLELTDKLTKVGKSGDMKSQKADTDYTKVGEHLLRMTLWGVSGLCRLVMEKYTHAGITPPPLVVSTRERVITLLQQTNVTPTPTPEISPTPTETAQTATPITTTGSPSPVPTVSETGTPTASPVTTETADPSPSPNTTDSPLVTSTPISPSPTQITTSPSSTPEITNSPDATVSPSPSSTSSRNE